MVKTKEQKLKDKIQEMRTFVEGTSLGKIQEQLAEVYIRLEELEK